MKSNPVQSLRILSPILFLTAAMPAEAEQMSDDFSDRPKLSGETATLSADTTSATMEPGEKHLASGRGRQHTVWAEWTAPANGTVVMNTLGTTFVHAMLAVYVGSDVSQLSTVAQGFDSTGGSLATLKFPVAAGQAYQIMLDSTHYNSLGDGPGTVNVRFSSQSIPASVVGEDVFANRPVLTGSQALGIANNKLASMDAYEFKTIGRREQTIWWEWTAPVTGEVTIDTLDSDFDTALTIFAGDPDSEDFFPDLDAIATGKDVPNSTRSLVKFQTQAGRTYQINVDGDHYSSYGEGNVVLRLNLVQNNRPAAIPGADVFERRGNLTGINAMGVASNIGFSLEASEQDYKGDRDKTAWWQWAAPADATMILDTINSSPIVYDKFITSVRIYGGSRLGELTEIASGNPISQSGWSQLTFDAKKGNIYQIVVDGGHYNGYGDGNIVLNLNLAPAPEISVQQPVGTELKDGKSRKSFGTVKIKSKGSTKLFTIRNTGKLPLTNLAVGKTGRNTGDFIVSRLPRTTLAPGASMNFPVVFSPRARGTKTATIVIRSNDKDESSFEIVVTGLAAAR